VWWENGVGSRQWLWVSIKYEVEMREAGCLLRMVGDHRAFLRVYKHRHVAVTEISAAGKMWTLINGAWSCVQVDVRGVCNPS
jgi:hypothetical protein